MKFIYIQTNGNQCKCKYFRDCNLKNLINDRNDDSIKKKKLISIQCSDKKKEKLSRIYDYFNKELIGWYC